MEWKYTIAIDFCLLLPIYGVGSFWRGCECRRVREMSVCFVGFSGFLFCFVAKRNG